MKVCAGGLLVRGDALVREVQEEIGVTTALAAAARAR
jgi:hypothetical protein